MRGKVRFPFLVCAVLAALSCSAQVNQIIYSDSRVNGWQDYGWATLNYNNASPVHSGTKSISVSATAYQALYLHHDAFDTSVYTNLTFWVNGGATGGQKFQIQALLYGVAQPAVTLAPFPTNSWQQISISLAALGVSNKSNMDGFWIQERLGTTQPTFYIDDIQLIPAPAPALVHINVNATQNVRVADARWFALNTAIWDASFDTTNTAALLKDMGNQALRFPGGSLSDEYHWASNTTGANAWTWATSFSKFAHIATNVGVQVFITVNYGSGTPQEAAAWVKHSNVTNNYAFKFWEIGNENYGEWETDTNSSPHDPFVYATRATNYIAQMKAADPTIKIGVVVETGEDSYANYTNHPATNLRTGQTHNGWTPVLLTTLKNLGVTPDFVIYHRYAQTPGAENDQDLLQSSRTWSNDAADLRQQLVDYLGSANTNVELICTENNSVYADPGKQSTSLVNGLFLADSVGQLAQTEFNALVWWDLRNSQITTNNNNAALYGWRPYGDYGIVSSTNDRYPAYFTGKLLKYFARGGDKIVSASSDYLFLSAYAARRTNGGMSLLVINKSASNSFAAGLNLLGFQAHSNVTAYSYGIPQDEAARLGIGSPDIAQTNFVAGTNFTFAPYSATVLSFSPVPPQLLLSSPAISNGQFRFQLQGQSGVPYQLQSSSNLSNWVSFVTNTLTNAMWQIEVTHSGTKFFRAIWLP